MLAFFFSVLAIAGGAQVSASYSCGFPDCVRTHPELQLPWPDEIKDMACAQRAAPEGAVRVACVGDSITAGYQSSGREHTYPSQLQALLDEVHGEGAFSVTNLGLCSSTMSKNADMPYWDFPHFKALVEAEWDIVIIMLGTNDAKDAGESPDNWQPSCERWGSATPGDCKFAEDYASLIDVVRSLGTSADGPRIYTAIPPPLMQDLEGSWGMNQTVINNILPDLIRRITGEAGVLGPIDAFTGLGGTPDWEASFPDGCGDNAAFPACQWFSDPCHPSDVGYHQLATLVLSGFGLDIGQWSHARRRPTASLRALSAR